MIVCAEIILLGAANITTFTAVISIFLGVTEKGGTAVAYCARIPDTFKTLTSKRKQRHRMTEPIENPANRHDKTAKESSRPQAPSKSFNAHATDILVETEAYVPSQSNRMPKPKGVNAQSKILWEYVIPVVGFHCLIPLTFIYYDYIFSWWGVAWLFVGNYIFTSLGIGAGYHRLLTHRGYKCHKWLEYSLATLGVASFQDSPARWVMVHRVHHQHSDHIPDPHTPYVSGFWSHVGWLFIDNRELSTMSAYEKYVRDLMRDPYYMWLQRRLNWVLVYVYHAIAITAVGFGLGFFWTGTLSGALQLTTQFFLWGVIYRTIFCWHVTWGINSVAHMWGYQNYQTRENSRNNWLLALLTNGEGWHNNHHADPRSAAQGHRWFEIDLTYRMICLFARLGLAWDVVTPNQALLDRRKL